MKVYRAKNAGFCTGVNSALCKLNSLVQERSATKQIYTLGPIIHNPQVLNRFAEKGVVTALEPKDVPPEAAVVIRSHGITQEMRDDLMGHGVEIVDATCQKVAIACEQVLQQTQEGRTLLLYGDASHPEVKCLVSYAAHGALVFGSQQECERLLLDPTISYCLAAQTTQDKECYQQIIQHLKSRQLDMTVLETICDATKLRQDEAIGIAEQVEYVVVVCGYESSNTKRLAQVVRAQGCKALHVETVAELPLEELRHYAKVGLTAGASTPGDVIDSFEQVLKSLGEDELSSTQKSRRVVLGRFPAEEGVAQPAGQDDLEALRQIRRPLYMVEQNGTLCLDLEQGEGARGGEFHGMVLPCPLERLGDVTFCRDHGVAYPYVGGSMAKGISSVEMVVALAEAGMLGFFGAAGLLLEEVEAAIDQLQSRVVEGAFGFNLIHSPNEPELERQLVELYIRRGVELIEASAFLDLTLPLVRFRTHGICRGEDGEIVTPNRIVAKISREEVAAKFFAPPPERMLQELVAAGQLTAEQAALAGEIPMAQDVTVEADSGGHTDNRPALALLPTIQAQKSSAQALYGYQQALRVGLGGGIATPASAAAAFALGAAYLVTGTVNQACVESGTCDEVRQMLAETRQADVTMAPSGDMFEMGVNVQVIKRGTMFSMRAAKLYELYRAYDSIEELPPDERQKLEKTVFRKNLDQVWLETRSYFEQRDPRQLAKAESDPKYKMALVFRWYLGQSPVWANRGESDRRLDYQIWCGPGMGAFNEWVKGSFLEEPARRQVASVAWNILFGAAVLIRANQLTLQGGHLEDETELTAPLEIDQIKEFLS